MHIIRKQPIYGNCQVFSPNGKLMFRCLEKRAKWYLDRKLAEKINDNPLSIKLTFVPNGEGESVETLKNVRENKCVVCGEKNLDVLTRHHIVPYEYRKHFSSDFKKHSSFFVVSICRDCHATYETLFASKLKEELSLKYQASRNSSVKTKKHCLLSIINTLIKHGEKIPEPRYSKIKNDFILLAKEFNLNEEVNVINIENLKQIYIKVNQELNIPNTHGELVANKITNFQEFNQKWMKHFIETMNPKFLPEMFKEYINNKITV